MYLAWLHGSEAKWLAEPSGDGVSIVMADLMKWAQIKVLICLVDKRV